MQLSLAAATKQGDEYVHLVHLAEERFQKTLAALPDHAPTYHQWGKLLHAQALRAGKDVALFAEALRKIRAARDIDPLESDLRESHAQVLLDFGRCLLQRAFVEKSKKYVRQALDKLREVSVRAWHVKAAAHVCQGRRHSRHRSHFSCSGGRSARGAQAAGHSVYIVWQRRGDGV